MSISVEDYFKAYADNPGITPVIYTNAEEMLGAVNALLAQAESEGVELVIDRVTGTLVGGEKNGGWRPQSCTIGAPNSAHKQGRAVDVYDPEGALDAWVNDAVLETYGLYREAPASTNGWCHLTDRAPASGHRTFQP